MTGISKRTAILLVGVSIVLTSCAQLLFRSAMQHFSFDWVTDRGIDAFIANGGAFSLSMLAFGLALYGCSMIVWIFALSRLSVGFAYPLLSLSYLIVYLAAVYSPTMQETPSFEKLVGCIIMVLGVLVMALDNRSTNSRGK